MNNIDPSAGLAALHPDTLSLPYIEASLQDVIDTARRPGGAAFFFSGTAGKRSARAGLLFRGFHDMLYPIYLITDGDDLDLLLFTACHTIEF